MINICVVLCMELSKIDASLCFLFGSGGGGWRYEAEIKT